MKGSDINCDVSYDIDVVNQETDPTTQEKWVTIRQVQVSVFLDNEHNFKKPDNFTYAWLLELWKKKLNDRRSKTEKRRRIHQRILPFPGSCVIRLPLTGTLRLGIESSSETFRLNYLGRQPMTAQDLISFSFFSFTVLLNAQELY